jgi:radial spoke head protein 4A
MDEWQKLPDCRQKYINIARKIKHIFPGNLDSKVITNPYFPGRECDLLRAQIARIVHSSTIAPSGLFGIDEEDENAVKDIKIVKGDDEQIPIIKLEGVMSLENWVHVNARLLNNGRVVHEAIEKPETADDD